MYVKCYLLSGDTVVENSCGDKPLYPSYLDFLDQVVESCYTPGGGGE